jgi:shikimate kinase
MLEQSIFITGFMGAGKSKIGRLLARRLGRIFMDTDEMVESRAGCTIAEIFAAEGEECFRRLERQCVAAAAQQADAVVALGGGAIVDERSAALIEAAGILVWIDASVDTILRRVSRREDRPLLAGLDAEQRRARIAELVAARVPHYSRARVRVCSGEQRSPEQTTDELLAALEAWSAQH